MTETIRRVTWVAGALLALVALSGTVHADELTSLQGTWVLDAAYATHADGSRATAYGEHPVGRLNVDAAGRYNLQIFKSDRAPFAAGDKTHGTAGDYRAAVLGSSTHFGSVTVDPVKHRLIFVIEAASFPNWGGKTQVRDYTFHDGLLRYAVPASATADGTVAYSEWRRVSS